MRVLGGGTADGILFPRAALALAGAPHLQLNSLLQVLVRLLDELFSPQHPVPHHVLGATAAGRDTTNKDFSVCHR